MESYLVSARHLNVTYHLSLFKRKGRIQLISCFSYQFSYTENGISFSVYTQSRVPC